MNLKKALPTITVILAVIAPGFLAISATIDNVSLNARASPFFRVLTMNLSSFSITSLISHFSIFFVFLFHYSDDYLAECCIVHSA